jgi:hypothetical protein
MATANLPGGAEYSGALLTSFVGRRGLKNQITLPTPPTTDINGNRLIYVNQARANIGGGRRDLCCPDPTVSRRIRFEVGPYVSDYFTVQATASNANPPLTGTIGIGGLFLNPVTTDFVVKTEILDGYIRYLHLPVSSLNIFSINADNSTATTLQTNRGLTGSYQYFYAPAAPTGLSLSSEQPTSVTLNWSAPADKGDTTITGYRVEYSVNSNFSGAQVIDINFAIGSTPPDAQSRSITGLALDRTYYFRVASKNGVTDEAGSYSVWSGTIQKNSRPNTPSINVSRSDLTYTISGSTTIGDGSVASHRFSSRTSTDGGVTFGDWSSETTIGTSSYSTTFSSTAARSYQFRVRAVSATGLFGVYRESSVVHTPAIPLIPTTAIFLSKNVRKVTVDWDPFRTNANAITNYNGAIISGYQVEERYSIDGGVTWTSYSNIASTNASTTVFLTNDLLIAKTYQFRVRANSDVGFSAYQDSSIVFISAYGQRRDASGFVPTENAKRFDGTSWITIGMVKRFNGTTWVDIQN